MDIQYVILGLLSRQAFSGYDLKKIISESDLYYWSGNNNQIYSILLSLHRDGLVTQRVQLQESLPAKKIYTITEAGLAKLQQSARSDPKLPELHTKFLIQLAWTEGLSDDEVDVLLGRYENELALQVRMRLAQPERPLKAPGRSAREDFLWQKISENIVGQYQHELVWVRQVRQGLKTEKMNIGSGLPEGGSDGNSN